MSTHEMITRSSSIKISGESSDIDDDSDYGLDDDIDEYGNITDLIDYSYDDKNELALIKNRSKLNKINSKKIKKNYKKDNKNEKLADLFIKYLTYKANESLNKKKLDNTGKITLEIDGEADGIDHIYKKQKVSDKYSPDNLLDYDSESNESDVSNYSDDSDDSYEEEYNKICNVKLNRNKEKIYFKKLNNNKKGKIIAELKEINMLNDKSVPLKFKILNSEMPIDTKSIAIEQIDKISEMDSTSGEYSKMDHWITGLTKIPFSKVVQLPINDKNSMNEKKEYLKKTYDTLNSAIYGHIEAKSHILQLIGKWIKNPNSGGNVLALQGPMGNGKTTLVKEGISKAIQRPFSFIALGGASDSSYFDGHNFTYEGSRWGRIVDILMQSKCMNPVFYFDELDKVSDTYKGQEIIHLLTHLTDPSQNDQYQDNYFSGIKLDLSKALFIFSFNDEHKIDKILKDRMYVIRTKGFKVDEKLEIVKKYLLPELFKIYNSMNNIYINDDIVKNIIEKYTKKEEGVRNLKRCLETIISKLNMYEMLYDSTSNKSEIDISFNIKDFKIPYHVKLDDISILLKCDIDDNPPEHMYL